MCIKAIKDADKGNNINQWISILLTLCLSAWSWRKNSYTFTCTIHRYSYKCMRIVYIMVQTCKCIGNVHTMAQVHKNYRPFDITITVSSMIYYLVYVVRQHDPN